MSAGSDEKRVFTTICSPSFLLITLRGLKALNALSAFKLLSVLVSAPEFDKVTARSASDAHTIKKSSMFQPLKMYASIPGIELWKKPTAVIFINASIVNNIVKIKSKKLKV